MKKLAIRGKIGDWAYYLTNLTFQEVNDNVKKIDSELHQSKTLSEMIQRELTDNVKKIKEYIETQEERFFNALVLAVYDGNPEWREIEIDYGDGEIYDVGILEFTGKEKIFPVDGQHRVEGIKLALNNKDNIKNDTIPVILIGHKEDIKGRKRTRRLFSTLNRYAKPVTLNDIIALDEDDSIAISTRDLIENNVLFADKRIANTKQKAINATDKASFTNIISLYDCNFYLIKQYITQNQLYKNKKILSQNDVKEYCRFRPDEKILSDINKFVNGFWNAFSKNITVIKQYLSVDVEKQPALQFRNDEGGNLLFRPIGQRPFIKVALNLYENLDDWDKVMLIMNKIELNIVMSPWKNVVWNAATNRIERGSNATLIYMLLQYMVDKTKLTKKEIEKLVRDYKEKLHYENKTNKDVINELDEYVIKE